MQFDNIWNNIQTPLTKDEKALQGGQTNPHLPEIRGSKKAKMVGKYDSLYYWNRKKIIMNFSRLTTSVSLQTKTVMKVINQEQNSQAKNAKNSDYCLKCSGMGYETLLCTNLQSNNIVLTCKQRQTCWANRMRQSIAVVTVFHRKSLMSAHKLVQIR